MTEILVSHSFQENLFKIYDKNSYLPEISCGDGHSVYSVKLDIADRTYTMFMTVY